MSTTQITQSNSVPALMATTPTPQVSTLPGVKELLIGGSGSGKTFAIRSLPALGITPYCIFTEPGFETLGDMGCDKVHWQYIKPAASSWEAMIDSATKINTLSFESLTKLPDINKRQHGQYIDFLKALNHFKCDRCGKEMPPVEKWGTDCASVVDSLSGLSIMAMRLMVGTKPVKSQADWGVAMDNLEALVQQLCMNTFCHFIMMAHAEREVDEVSGGTRVMASTLGRKLAPKIPRFFSDVIMTRNDAGKFTWSTAEMGMDLKVRNLPIAANLEPTFATVIKTWQSRGGKILPSAL